MPFDDIASGLGSVARRKVGGDAKLRFQGVHIGRVDGFRYEAVALKMLHPDRTAPAAGVLVDGDSLLLRRLGATDEQYGSSRQHRRASRQTCFKELYTRLHCSPAFRNSTDAQRASVPKTATSRHGACIAVSLLWLPRTQLPCAPPR